MTAVCAICGDAVDDDQEFDHGHFSSGDDEDDEMVCLFVEGARKDRLACGRDPDSNTWSPDPSDVNCTGCRAAM